MEAIFSKLTGKPSPTPPKRDDKWRSVLENASAELHEKLQPSPVFVALLLKMGIVKVTLQSEINNDTNPQQKIRKILEQVLSGTEDGYKNFCEALKSSNQRGALQCLEDWENELGYRLSDLTSKSKWTWLENVYGKSGENKQRKHLLDEVLLKNNLLDFSRIADKTGIANMEVTKKNELEFRRLRAVCRASRPNTLTIIPWSKRMVDVPNEIDLPSLISDVNITSHSSAKIGFSLKLQPLFLNINDLCQTFDVAAHMVIDLLHSRSQVWSEDARVLKYLLQNGKEFQCSKTNLLRITEVRVIDDYKCKKAKGSLSSTHQVEHVIRGLHKCFILHSPESDLSEGCDHSIERHAKTLDRLPASIFEDSSTMFGKHEMISITTPEPGKNGFSTKDEKWCNIKEIIRESLNEDRNEVLWLDISLLREPSEEFKPSKEPNICQEFIESYQKLEEIERECQLIKSKKISRHLSDALHNETKEKFNEVIKSEHNTNHVMRHYSEVESCVQEYRANYPQGDIMPGFKENMRKKLCAQATKAWFLEDRESSEVCDPTYYKGKWINVVLLGKPNCGTSSTCNTLIGEPIFKTGAGLVRVTRKVGKHEFTLEDMNLRVINTPALYDDTDKQKDDQERNPYPVAAPAIPHIEKIMEMCEGEIHVFLHVQSGVARFTEEEMRVLESIKETLGSDALKNVAFVITRAEQILGHHHTLCDFMKAGKGEESTETYKKAVYEAQKRQVMIDNEYESECLKEIQRSNLLQLIKMTIHDSKGEPFKPNDYSYNRRKQMIKNVETILESYLRINQHIEDMYKLQKGSFHKDCLIVKDVGGIERFVDIAARGMERRLGEIETGNSDLTETPETKTMRIIIANPRIILRALEHKNEDIDGKAKGSAERIINDLDEEIKKCYRKYKHENVRTIKSKVDEVTAMWVEDLSEKYDLPKDAVQEIVVQRLTEAIAFYKRALCFPASSSVQSKGDSILMKDLNIGDKVKVVDKDGNVGYEQVIYFSHKKEKTNAKYRSLTTESGARLSIAGSHLLHCNNMGSLKAAAEVKVGDIVYTVAEDNVITPQVVNFISDEGMDGIYCPHTLSGTIVVDNVLTSCYTTILPQPLMHLLFRSLIFMFGIIPTRAVNWLTTVDAKTGYPPFLETLVNYYAKG